MDSLRYYGWRIRAAEHPWESWQKRLNRGRKMKICGVFWQVIDWLIGWSIDWKQALTQSRLALNLLGSRGWSWIPNPTCLCGIMGTHYDADLERADEIGDFTSVVCIFQKRGWNPLRTDVWNFYHTFKYLQSAYIKNTIYLISSLNVETPECAY